MQRRTFLTGAFAATTALALGASVYLPPSQWPGAEQQNHRALFAILLPVLLDGALPQMPGPRQQAIDRTLDAIDTTIATLPSPQRSELMLLLNTLENRLGVLILTGSLTPVLLRTPAELIAMLDGWRQGYLAMQQQAYLGLRELVMAAFYACPEHWAALNYHKPDI